MRWRPDLGLPASGAARTKCLLFKGPCLWSSVTAARADADECSNGLACPSCAAGGTSALSVIPQEQALTESGRAALSVQQQTERAGVLGCPLRLPDPHGCWGHAERAGVRSLRAVPSGPHCLWGCRPPPRPAALGSLAEAVLHCGLGRPSKDSGLDTWTVLV